MNRKLILLLMTTSLVLAFQDCSDAQFSAPSNPPGSDESLPPPENGVKDDPNDPGLDGGHFDLDTSSQVYPLGSGHTDHHVHEYDDKHNVTGVDFFNMLETGYTEVASRVGPTQSFIIIVANAQLSTGGILEINGTDYAVATYQQKVDAYRGGAPALAVFTLTGANPLTSFKMKFHPDAITAGGLIPTQTGCVVGNDAGANGEYRDGALTVQILDAATAVINPATKTAAAGGGLLWEATIFWHKDGAGCY